MCRSNARRRALWHAPARFLPFVAAAAFGALLLGAPPAAGQPLAPPAGVAGLAAARVDAESAHLRRVGVWGGTALLGGAALFLLSGDADGQRAFGLQTAAWGVVNVAIAGVALARGPDAAAVDLATALADESRLREILWLNQGLNAGYVAVGATLFAVGARADVARPDVWRGHGAAVMIQGAGLLVLDGLALASSSGRRDGLLGLVGDAVTLAPTAGGVALTVAL